MNHPQDFDFNTISQNPIYKSLPCDGLKRLWETCLNGSYLEYSHLVNSDPLLLPSHGIKENVVVRKVKLLTLVRVAGENIGQPIEFDSIASPLNEHPKNVEFWIIEATRCRLIAAKIDQSKQLVTCKSAISINRNVDFWTKLGKKLENVRSNVDSYLNELEQQ